MKKLGISDDAKRVFAEMSLSEWKAFERLRAAAEGEIPDDFYEVPSIDDYNMEKALTVVWIWVHLKFKITELRSQIDSLDTRLGAPTELDEWPAVPTTYLESGMAKVYQREPAFSNAIAALCDEYIDPSGKMLGRVRVLASGGEGLGVIYKSEP